ncbi:hypothetical protein FRX31_022169, partial [Thalictrum thalictroides]
VGEETPEDLAFGEDKENELEFTNSELIVCGLILSGLVETIGNWDLKVVILCACLKQRL